MADANEEFEQAVQAEMSRLAKLDELTTKPLLEEIPDSPLKPLVEFVVTGEEEDERAT